MEERREKLISEIKEVAERIEVTLSDYRTRYYKEIPEKSREKILKWLKSAYVQTEILIFEKDIQKWMYVSGLIKVDKKANIKITNIYNYLENAVNEVLKYYNEEFADSISELINPLARKLMKLGYKVENEFEYLSNRLKISNCISLYEEKYPELVELQDIISIITDIDSIRPGTLVPEIHELYGAKTLLLELEESIKIIETMENSSCINVILEYIDYMINWNWFKEIR